MSKRAGNDLPEQAPSPTGGGLLLTPFAAAPPQQQPARQQRDDDDEPAARKLRKKLEAFGLGTSQIKCRLSRRVPGEGVAYLRMFNAVDDEFLEHLEETIAETYGGGTYQCSFLGAGGSHTTTVVIDERAHPAKRSSEPASASAAVTPSPAPATSTPAQLDPAALAAMIAQAVAAAIAPLVQQHQAPAPATPAPSLDADLARAERLLSLVKRNEPAAAAAAVVASAPKGIEDELDRVAKIMSAVDKLRGGVAGVAGAPAEDASPKRKLGERLLEGAVDKLTDKLADKIGDKVSDAFLKETGATSGASKPAPSTPAPTSPSPSTPTPPGGSRALSPEQLERVRAKQRQLETSAAPSSSAPAGGGDSA